MVGPYSNETVRLTIELKIRDSFIFTGPVPYNEMPFYYAAMDVLVAPFNPAKFQLTRKFGFYYSPIKLFEYMASGKPIVTTRIETMEGILKHEENALLVTPGNIKELAQAVLRILENPMLSHRLGVNSRKLVEEKYSWEKISRRINDLLRSVV
jgi:glycosyltransferase involved in cell wall biosynthesis